MFLKITLKSKNWLQNPSNSPSLRPTKYIRTYWSSNFWEVMQVQNAELIEIHHISAKMNERMQASQLANSLAFYNLKEIFSVPKSLGLL